MTYFAVNKDGTEICCNLELFRNESEWTSVEPGNYGMYSIEEEGDPDICIVKLPKGTIKRIFGIDMTWEDNYKTMLNIGDKCKTTKKLYNAFKAFEIGTSMTITDIDELNGYSFVDNDGVKCTECGWDGFEKID